MSLNWADASQAVLGLILDKRISVNTVHPDMFTPPYDQAIKLLKNNPATSIEELIMQTGFSTIQDSFETAHRMNGLGDKNWVKMLEQSRSMYSAGTKMARWSKKLTDGGDIDWAELRGLLNDVEVENIEDFKALSEISDEAMPFIPTGWKAFDDHLEGLPEVGVVILGGMSGVGKTTMALRLIGSFAKRHTNKNIAFFSLEMMLHEVGPRMRSLMTLTKDEQNRIKICDKPLSIPDIISKAASIDDLGLVVIDYIDLTIDGEISTSTMDQCYIALSKAAKQLHCPIIAIAQLRDFRGIPKDSDFRFTRLSRAIAWMILMCYNPSTTYERADKDSWEEKEHILPVVENKAYIVAWKVRGGFRKHQDESPGAIMMPFNPATYGWHPTDSKWFSLKRME